MLVLASFLELLSMFLLWSTFKFNDKYRIPKVLLITILSLTFFSFANFHLGLVANIIISFGIFVVLVMLIFNTRFIFTFISVTFCHVILILYEFMYLLLHYVILKDTLISDKNSSTIAAFIMLCLVIYVHQTDLWKKAVNKIAKYAGKIRVNSKFIWILNALGYYFILMVIWESNPVFFLEHKVFLFSILFLIAFVNYYIYRSDVFLSEKIAMEQYYQKYYPQLIGIVEDIRAKQHEYKNHLNTINGIVEVSGDDLRASLKSYLDSISSSNDDIMIVKGDNIVLNAVIYSKMVEAKGLLINFTYYIANIKEVPLEDFELTEIVSNLVNNAFEQVCNLPERNVELEVYKNNNLKQLYIVVSNTGCINVDISSLVKKGYSTKRHGRGYGLHNVKKITDYKKGKLSMSVDQNKTVFEVTIPYSE